MMRFAGWTRPEGSTLEARNRAIHRMLVDGITVEYRNTEGAVRGAQAQVLDFNDPDRNGLACYQPVHRHREQA